MVEALSVGTLADVLASRRRQRFVGRRSELELFGSALRASEPPFSVLWLHGPGGIGKTTLLAMFGEAAHEAGVAVVHLDGHDVEPTPAALLARIAGAVGAHGEEDLFAQISSIGRVVLLVDTLERLAPVDDWLRTWLLPQLPPTALAVLASRAHPATAWRADPGWDGLLRVVSLRNLGPEEAEEYLARRGIDGALLDRVFSITHGHPLGLSLVADVAARGGDLAVDPLAPDLVGSLLRRFVEVVPSLLHRRALEVCALTRATTEALLRDALGVGDAHELFTWLRRLSFVESRPDGVSPHDLARDALVADLRWRDPESYQKLFRGVSAHITARLKATQGREQQRVLFDAKFLHRYQPVSKAMCDWESLGQYYPERATPADRAGMVELAEAWEGPASAALVDRWCERQPEGFFVIRGHDGIIKGFLGAIELTGASPEDVAADPGARAAYEYAQRLAPPRAGEVMTQARFIVDRDAHQRPSPTVNCAPVLSIQHWLGTPSLSWSFITVADPEAWEEFFPFFDIHRAQEADFEVGGRRYGLFAHDFRRVPVDAWLELMFERDLTGDLELGPSGHPQTLIVLSEPEFAEAVRSALRDLHRTGRLAHNPLVRSRLVQSRAEEISGAEALGRVVREAAERLRTDARDEKLFRAIDRTFLRPAVTQERAAEVLDLPFSTYRRHLARGIKRIVADLWDQELEIVHVA